MPKSRSSFADIIFVFRSGLREYDVSSGFLMSAIRFRGHHCRHWRISLAAYYAIAFVKCANIDSLLARIVSYGRFSRRYFSAPELHYYHRIELFLPL